MAIIKGINSRASIANAINYITKKEKTEYKLISGIECSPDTALDEMKATKAIWGKNGGRQYKHYVQSFSPDENITPELAHEIALKLFSNRYKGFEALIATHKDREHIHSHIIINSVNYINGKKFQESNKDFQNLMDDSDKLCQEYGFSICQKNDEITSSKQSKYRILEKALKNPEKYKSYLLECFKSVMQAKSTAISKEHFIALMENQGYKTNWSNRKYITFTDQDGNKIRNSNLEKTFKESLGKEVLEDEFKINSERADRTTAKYQQYSGTTGIRTDNIESEIRNRQITSISREIEQRKSRESREDYEVRTNDFRNRESKERKSSSEERTVRKINGNYEPKL